MYEEPAASFKPHGPNTGPNDVAIVTKVLVSRRLEDKKNCHGLGQSSESTQSELCMFFTAF